MSDQIARDLERKIIEGLQAYIDREFKLASMFMSHVDLGLLLMKIAAGTTATAAATLANMANDTTTPAALFDQVLRLIAERAAEAKGEAMARVAQARGAVA